jgi:hypothetical protein
MKTDFLPKRGGSPAKTPIGPILPALGIAVLSLLAGGCNGPAKAQGASPASAAVSGGVLDLRALSEAFWSVKRPFDPAARPATGSGNAPRLAIVEFTVQYEDGAASKDAGPAADFGTGMKLELPTLLYEGFAGVFTEFNRAIVPLETVAGAAAYRRLKGIETTDPTLLDPGKGGTRYPAEGLLALEDGQAEADAAIRDLLREVGADGALQVRLIVGVVDGRAAIIKGSTVRGVGPDKEGILESRMTLISALPVVDKPMKEGPSATAAIQSIQFVKAMANLSRLAVGMGLVALGRTE